MTSARVWGTVTGIVAVFTIAPWAVYLGGLAKFTSEINGGDYSEAMKNRFIMLDWYVLAAQLFYLLVLITCAFAKWLRRTASMHNMWLAVNSALLVYISTQRLTQIDAVNDDMSLADIAAAIGLDVVPLNNPLPYLRAEVAGTIMCATMNFFLTILISIGGTAEPEEGVAKAAAA
ncbi:hypothetical protein HYH03_010949 [Edaphochlamys debaryana]|uniref:Uncharacterized protein n=1 Tax=Edaphochlamys debaryana TaxID=47281 RepID=A0A836BVK5_9CHLO|nr:hypothetical protein HYH03_010949 [Edaphochlamys debaryana]|eukprot:KAG2490555.1 hypothetical protein HYH03_010949 [Edaphochlamys debaryana]